MKREPVDFFTIRAGHEEIHARLQNWAAWGRGHGHRGQTLPMFQNYRPEGYYELPGGGLPIDSLDAVKLQKLMIVLPEKHRWSVQWSYAFPWIRVEKVCRVLAVSRQGLGDLVHGGRVMLKNRSEA